MIKDYARKLRLSLENKALFKGKDLKLVNEVREYLASYGFSPEILGGVKKSLMEASLPHYLDIDLAIESDGILVGSDKYLQYANAVLNLYNASLGIKKINNWIVEDHTKEKTRYVNLYVDYRYIIKDPKTNTVIDLTFGRSSKKSPFGETLKGIRLY